MVLQTSPVVSVSQCRHCRRVEKDSVGDERWSPMSLGGLMSSAPDVVHASGNDGRNGVVGSELCEVSSVSKK